MATWYHLHTSLPSHSTLHIHRKFQWMSEQLKSAYLDLQYFQGRSSKFTAEHLSLLLEWFTPFFVAIIPSLRIPANLRKSKIWRLSILHYTPPPPPRMSTAPTPPLPRPTPTNCLRTLYTVLHDVHGIKMRFHHCNDELIFVIDWTCAKLSQKPYNE